MIRDAWRKAIRFVGSAGFATGLMVVIAVYAMVATLIPQVGESWGADPQVWAAEHPVLEQIAQTLWLHRAFTSPIFIGLALVLGLSTALCAWARTKVAIGKARTLRRALATDAEGLAARHDFSIPVADSFSDDEVLARTSDTLERLGVRASRRESVLSSISQPWSVWGSPVFHWALLALIVALAAGNLLRAEGQMGLAVGQSKPDNPSSYGIMNAGVMRNWSTVQRSFRLDAFEQTYVTDGIDRGGTPTVALLDKDGNVVRSQRVYPNATLKHGSVTVYPKDYGLAVEVSIADPSGAVLGRSVQLVDFDPAAENGTVSSGYLVINDGAGNPQLKVYITVPVASVNGQLDRSIPDSPRARFVMRTLDNQVVLDQTVAQGEGVDFPAGKVIFNGVGYYARLQIVDDSSIPLLYLGFIVATLGLTLAVVVRQRAVLAAVAHGDEGRRLVVAVRFWRNAPTDRDEIRAELTRVLGTSEKGSES